MSDAATTGSPAETRIVLVDPDAEARAAAVAALTQVGLTDIEPLADALALRTRIATGPPADLALLSLRLGDEVPSLVAEVRAAGWLRVLVSIATPTAEDVTACLAHGATGAILGRRHAAPLGPVPTGVHELSERELEVIRMVADGRSNKWIGAQLHLSALTVKSHLARIGRKLGSGDRAHIVAQALRAGVIE